MQTALEIADYLIRSGQVRESHGKNRSPVIDEIVTRFGGKLGAPYCAYGISYCFRKVKLQRTEAGQWPKDGIEFPYTGSSQAIMRHFKAKGKLFTNPNLLLRCKGALFGWTNADKVHGHVGMVKNRFTDNGQVVAIGTNEFNTSLRTKDRDGEGAYFLRRDVIELQRTHPNFWFCDVSEVVGGSWWE